MKLFWKLFITLGVAMTIAMVAAVTLGWTAGGLAWLQWFSFDFEARETIINRASVALNRGGRDELTEWLEQNQTPAPGRILYIVDDAGNDLLGRELPGDAPRVFLGRDNRNDGDGRTNNWRGGDRRFERYSEYGAMQNRMSPRFTDTLFAPNGEGFRLLFQSPGITLLDVLNLPATRVGVVTVAILLAAATALLFAKSLSSPIVRLQRATRGLAAGALDTRVGKPFVQRKDEIGTLARDFDAMAEQIQGLITDKEMLLRDVSHELRSPLARIRVALALAQRKADQSAEQDLDRIEQETERLDQLVGQILTLARLRTSTDERFDDVDLASLLREVVADARFERADTDVIFEPKTVPAVRGNAGELASAVENVLRNALIHAGSDGEVRVDLERGPDNDVLITVSDNGPGVADSDLKRLFEPFYRVDPSRDHGQSGYGLGLAIAARIIEKHHGTVEASNRPGGGLSVTFRLPIGV
jgi:signal transduction histidine kinase